MPSLITAYNAAGEVTGECDARCYDAKHDCCTCICQGRAHGLGLARATVQVAKHAAYLRRAALVDDTTTVKLGTPVIEAMEDLANRP